MYCPINGILVAEGVSVLQDNETRVHSIHCTAQSSKLGHLQYVGKDEETDTVEQTRASHNVHPGFSHPLTAPTVSTVSEWAMCLSAGLHR